MVRALDLLGQSIKRGNNSQPQMVRITLMKKSVPIPKRTATAGKERNHRGLAHGQRLRDFSIPAFRHMPLSLAAASQPPPLQPISSVPFIHITRRLTKRRQQHPANPDDNKVSMMLLRLERNL